MKQTKDAAETSNFHGSVEMTWSHRSQAIDSQIVHSSREKS